MEAEAEAESIKVSPALHVLCLFPETLPPDLISSFPSLPDNHITKHYCCLAL